MLCILHVLSGDASSSRKHVGGKSVFHVFSAANCLLLLVGTVELPTHLKFS